MTSNVAVLDMQLPGKVTINKGSLIHRSQILSCSHGYMIKSGSDLGTKIEPRGV